MTYNPNIPQPPDLPSDSQPDILTDFLSLNEVFGVDHIPFGNSIEEATLANPCVCTSTNHRLTTGDTVTVYNMEGIDLISVREDWVINNTSFTVTVIDEDTFSLDGSDSTTYPVYIPNSGDFSSTDLPYGYHTKNFFPTTRLDAPNLTSPKSSYFPQNVENLAQLFFQNGATAADKVPLTQVNTTTQTIDGRGFITPWGLIINMGTVVARSSGFSTFNYPVPYTSTVFGLILTRGRPLTIDTNDTSTKTVVGQSINLNQFQASYAASGSTVGAHIKFLAVGI